MKKIQVFLLALSAVLGFLPAVAQAHVVTAPYWCGSYYSSYPCSYQQPQYYNQQYQYSYQYPNNNYNPVQQVGYWGYCYQTVAPMYGQSYRYPCYYYNYQTYNYNPGYQPSYTNYYYNGYYPY